MLIQEARRAGVEAVFEYDAAEFTLKGNGMRTYLGNFFDAYCQASPEHKKKLIGNFVETIRLPQIPETFDEARTKLVTVIRERALFTFTDDELRIQGNQTGLGVAYEPVSTWYVKSLVIDFPQCVSVVTRENLKKWDVPFSEACELGVQRLRQCTSPKFAPENGYFAGKWNDDYDSSRVLLPEIFRGLPLDGDPVAVIPNRLTLLVTGSRQTAAIKAMLARAEEIMKTVARPQNPSPLIIRNGEVTDFFVEKSSPVFYEVQRAHKIAELIYNDQQVALLDKVYKKTGKKMLVAKCLLNKLPDGTYRSQCVWMKGVVSMLPKTDVVWLSDPLKPEKEQILGMVAWDKMMAIAGDLFLDTEIFPPRYYVSKFPDAEMLRRLLG